MAPGPPRTTADAGAVATPAVVFVSEPDYRLPIAGALSCPRAMPTSPTNPPPKPKRKVYDFEPIRVAPLRRGPTIAERPYVGYERTFEHARAMLFRRSDVVTACWKWASARGAKETTLSVEVTVDPRVSTTSTTVTSAAAGDDELIACVNEMFVPATWSGPRSRTMRVSAELVFNNDQPTWPKPPARPKGPTKMAAMPRALTCPADSSTDEIRLPALIVTNWDDRQVRAADALIPARRTACAVARHEIDKAAIRIALRSQIGALNACYAEAAQRTPDLAGDVGAKLLFYKSGTTGQVQVAGAGDPILHACFTTVLEALWVDPVTEPQEIEVNLALTLAPVPPPSADPSVLLETGDVDAALAVWVEQLAAPHLPLNGCLAHAGILRAMTTAAPWLDDARVTGAIANLARSALALAPQPAKTCLAGVEGLLRNYVRLGGNWPPPIDRPMRHLERYEAVLPLAGLFEWGPYLRWHHADWLLRTSRAVEGEDALSELASDPTVGAAVTTWLEQRAARPEMLHDTCWE